MQKFGIFALALGFVALPARSFADPVIIGANVFNDTAFNATSLSILSASTNTAGAVIKTMIVGCNSSVTVYAQSPSGVQVDLLYCQGSPSSGAATLPSPVYLPPGWLLALANSSTATAGINMSYDLQ